MVVSKEARRYPRAAVDQAGTLHVRSTDRKIPARKMPAAIRSISCEGAGLALRDEHSDVARLTTVTMDFMVDGQRFEIPGLVVWVAGARPRQVGVKFLLAAVPNVTRQAYANWVVELLRKKGN